MEYYYTDERNAQILIYLLKAHGIRRVIASPGTTNICFVASIQNDPYFEMYSAADERSAGYMACGMAAETNEPVVLSCTGATASRNYMPPLTEAYYRKLPVLAVTSSRRNTQIGHNIDQVTDRTLLPRDIAKISVQLPLVFDDEGEWGCIISANKAILELTHRGKGPVHINLETNYSRNYSVRELPQTRVIKRYMFGDEMPKINACRVAIMVGAHLKWSDRLISAVEDFCENNNAVVLCDHTSNYKGKYRIFANLLAQQSDTVSITRQAELVIHIGDVSASNYRLLPKAVWRVNPDGELRDTYHRLTSVFEMSEEDFFSLYANKGASNKDLYYEQCKQEEDNVLKLLNEKLCQLPFSNIWIASQLAKKIPNDSVLHFGIQNSLRSWNFFDVDEHILGYSNTGGFGIDGSLSSVIGASLMNPNRTYFCVLGDLAFFYDMNALGNRHVKNNIRILLINNGKGSEFKLITNPGAMFGKDTDIYIAAAGHYGKQSPTLVKHYAEDLGFMYLSASTKESFLSNAEVFLSRKPLDKPIIFEVFTDTDSEDSALYLIRHLNEINQNEADISKKMKNAVKDFLGEKGIQTVKRMIGK